MREITNFLRVLSNRLNYILDKNDTYKVVFVMGNASCDIDSFTSSILFYFMRNIEVGLITCQSTNEITFNVKKEGNVIFIPVINCVKEELLWRLEIAELIKKMDLTLNDFFFFNECFDSYKGVNFTRLQGIFYNLEFSSKHEYCVILMDHHELDNSQKFLADYVTEIIDHHSDKGFDYSFFKNLKNENINCQYPRSSNVCLVLERFFNSDIIKTFLLQSLTNDNNYYDFLIAVIVIDSENFNPKIKDDKWIQKDQDVASKILDMSKKSIFFNEEEQKKYISRDNSFHFDNIAKNLIEIKFSEEKNLELGAKGLLQKDRKNFTIKDYFISMHSLPVSLFKLIQREENLLSQGKETEKLKDVLSFLAKEDSLHIMIMTCRDNEVPLITIYLHKNEYFNSNNIFDFYNYLNSKLCNGNGQISQDKDFFFFKTTTNINRKILWPEVQGFFTNLK